MKKEKKKLDEKEKKGKKEMYFGKKTKK